MLTTEEALEYMTEEQLVQTRLRQVKIELTAGWFGGRKKWEVEKEELTWMLEDEKELSPKGYQTIKEAIIKDAPPAMFLRVKNESEVDPFF